MDEVAVNPVPIPQACMHGSRFDVMIKALPDCRWCKGTGRVPYESDDFPPGWNGCCCTCARCRAMAGVPHG